MIVAILRGKSFALRAMQDGAQAADRFARHVHTIVDDQAGDRLLLMAALHARFLFVNGESFVVRDVSNARE